MEIETRVRFICLSISSLASEQLGAPVLKRPPPKSIIFYIFFILYNAFIHYTSSFHLELLLQKCVKRLILVVPIVKLYNHTKYSGNNDNFIEEL